MLGNAQAAWKAPQMQQHCDWIVELTPSQVDELSAAAISGMRANIPIADLNPDNFPVPMISDQLREIHEELIHRRGFVLLRGMPVDELSREGIIRAYVGLSSYLGTAVPQNKSGHLVGHVKDIGNDPKDPATRIYTTTYRQAFHTDSCDVVGLLCLQSAKAGGASAIASSTSIYLHMLEHSPELAAQLKLPYVYDRKDEIPQGKEATYKIPVVHEYDGHINVFYVRDFIDAALQRFPDLASMTKLQKAALDEFDRLANSDQFKLEMEFRKGDIQYLHNHQILHARTSYEDFDDPVKKRHLIRLWLSAHNPRSLPKAYEERYGEIIEGEIRGGIRVPGVEPVTPLEA